MAYHEREEMYLGGGGGSGQNSQPSAEVCQSKNCQVEDWPVHAALIYLGPFNCLPGYLGQALTRSAPVLGRWAVGGGGSRVVKVVVVGGAPGGLTLELYTHLLYHMVPHHDDRSVFYSPDTQDI